MSRIIKLMRGLYHRSYQSDLSWNRLKDMNRTFHCGTRFQVKMYMEHENRYAYGIMESKGYVSDIYTVQNNAPVSTEQFNLMIEQNWSLKTPAELFDALEILGSYSSHTSLCISNKRFDSFIDELTDNIHNASDDQLKKLFYSLLKWPETPSIRTRNYIEVWVALDEECLKRMSQWSFDEMLSFITLFYMLNVTKNCDFATKAINKMTSKSKSLTKSQFLQTIFFTGIMRRSPFDVHNLEIYLDNNFSEFSIDELAIMSMGLFKSKTPIRNTDLIVKIINKIIDNSNSIHEVSLAALLKIVRYSFKLDEDNRIYKLLDALQHEIPRLSVMCIVQIALVGMATLTLHRECLENIAESTIKHISKCRLKDLERLVLTYGTFNVTPKTREDFFNKIMEELRKPERENEIDKFGRSFACCTTYLGHSGLYPVDLMNKALSPDFLGNTYGKYCLHYGREILSIHNTAKIFCSDAEMNFLSDKAQILLGKKYTDYVPDENYKKQYNASERMTLDIIKILRNYRGGYEYVIGDHILTHHQRGDIILCNDDNGRPLEVKKQFTPADFGKIRYPPDNNDWIVLVVGGRNALINISEEVTGPFQAKLRELRKLGYRASMVLWTKYSVLKTDKEKTDYLNSLIEKAI